MIEVEIMNYLSNVLNVAVFMERPDPKDEPTDFLILDKLGSSTENYIYSISLAIQSYSSTMAKAAILNENVKKAMEDILSLNSISKCKIDTDYPFNDTQTKRYRYQAVYDIVTM